ncbi:hypothetical protein OG21DRAFT_1517462 [Imleria badia]|nr:hypothetical protein OG21DRAFT_1517462 [Imleria badia]
MDRVEQQGKQVHRLYKDDVSRVSSGTDNINKLNKTKEDDLNHNKRNWSYVERTPRVGNELGSIKIHADAPSRDYT